MTLRFVSPKNPILRKVAKEVPENQINSPQIKKLIESMLNMAFGQQKEKLKPIMVGLAATQVGVLKRIIFVDVDADGKGKVGDLRVYINPKITWKSQEKHDWYEGCYSTSRVCGIVSRSNSIRIKGFTMLPSKGHPKYIEEEYTGYVARIFQHEIDHLNGKIFIDLINNPSNLHWVEENEFPLYRNKEAWRNWPKKYQGKIY